MEDYPRQILLPNYGEDERSAKSKKLMFILVVALIALAAFLYVNPFKNAPENFTQKAAATIAAAAKGETAAKQPFIFEFQKQVYESGDEKLGVEHNLRIDENGRSETATFTNEGDEPIEFTLIQITPSEVYDSNYSANSSILHFADAAPPNANAVIEMQDVALLPSEVFTTRVHSGATGQIGVLFIPVTGKNVDFDELQQLLKENFFATGERLSPQAADALSREITGVLNDDSKQWAEKKDALLALAEKPNDTTKSVKIEYAKTATEIQPGARFEIPVFGENAAQKTDLLFKRITGKLGDCNCLSPGYPKILKDGENQEIVLLFDFGGKIPVENGVFWNADEKKPLEELSGTAVVAFSGKIDEEIEIPLRVKFQHVNPEDFIVFSPRGIKITRDETDSIKKPVFAVNNLPLEIKNACGSETAINIEPKEAKPLLFDYAFAEKTVATPSCALYPKLESTTVEASFDEITGIIYSQDDAIKQGKMFSWRSCADDYCTCEALSKSLTLLKQRFADDLRFIPDKQAYAELFGTDEYERETVILAAWLGDCELPQPFTGKIKEGAVNVVSLKARIDDAALADETPLKFEAGVRQFHETNEELAALDKQWIYASTAGVETDDNAITQYTYLQRCIPGFEGKNC